MAKRQQFKQSTDERRRRTFSEEFKRKKVREIEQKITTIAEVSREYDVRASNVSKWLSIFSNNHMKGVRTIVESESDTRKIIDQQQKPKYVLRHRQTAARPRGSFRQFQKDSNRNANANHKPKKQIKRLVPKKNFYSFNHGLAPCLRSFASTSFRSVST